MHECNIASSPYYHQMSRLIEEKQIYFRYLVCYDKIFFYIPNSYIL